MVNNVKYSHTGFNHIRSKTIFKNVKKNKIRSLENHPALRKVENNFSISEKTAHNTSKKNKVTSWIVDILNPSNHLPVIGTIKKLHSSAARSLDAVQSVIGGMIYGGPFGIIKGFGSWLAGKFINNDKVANKPIKTPKIYMDNLQSKNKNIDHLTSKQISGRHIIKARHIFNNNQYLINTEHLKKKEYNSELHKTNKYGALEKYKNKYEHHSNKIKISA